MCTWPMKAAMMERSWSLVMLRRCMTSYGVRSMGAGGSSSSAEPAEPWWEPVSWPEVESGDSELESERERAMPRWLATAAATVSDRPLSCRCVMDRACAMAWAPSSDDSSEPSEGWRCWR